VIQTIQPSAKHLTLCKWQNPTVQQMIVKKPIFNFTTHFLRVRSIIWNYNWLETSIACRCFNGMPGSRLFALSVDDDEHTGKPTSSTTPETVAQIQQLVHQDRHWTIHSVAKVEVIGYGTCQWVLMKRTGHALCCSQICAHNPDSWPEAAACWCLHWTSSACLWR
jgi:hypothetical protein